jgi:hypothetical protein
MEVLTRSTTASQRKRKSGDEDASNDPENTSPNLSPLPGNKGDNNVAKKLRFKGEQQHQAETVINVVPASHAHSSSKGAAAPVPAAAKSGLARYQKAPLSTKVASAVGATETKRAAERAAVAAASEESVPTASAAASSVPGLTVATPKTPTRSTAALLAVTAQTPATATKSAAKRRNSRGGTSSAAMAEMMPADNAVLKRLALFLNGGAYTNKFLSNELDSAFSVNEDKISSIMQALRAKVKGASWDFKEKNKKQETVIKELKDALTTTLLEIRPLKELCATKEAEIESLLREAHSELQTALASACMFKSMEGKNKKELEAVTEELTRVSKALRKLSEEHSVVKKSEQTLTTQCGELTTRVQTLEEQKSQSDVGNSSLQTELRMLKESSARATELLQAQYEQRIEQQHQLLTQEVTNLKADLSRRSSEAERSLSERSDLDKKHSGKSS